MKSKKHLILIILIAVFVAALNIWRVILGVFHIPQGYNYLAVGHYFYDYFEYVQQIAQGMWGHGLVNNPYGIFDPTKTLIGWGQYLIYGKIGSLFHWSPFFTYWVIIFVQAIVLCLLLFQLVKNLLPKETINVQIVTLLFALFATPFIKITLQMGQLKIIPYDIWYSPMSFFHRFGGVPHHLATNIFVVLLLILIANLLVRLGDLDWNKIIIQTLLICSLLILFVTFAPFQVINLISGLTLTVWFYLNQFLANKNKKKIFQLILFLSLILAIIVPAALFIKLSHQSGDLFKRTVAWEVSQQSYPSFCKLLAMTGPILIFVPFGVKLFFKSVSPLRLLFFLYAVFSYLYYYTPLSVYLGSHNSRFINPVSYVLFAVLAYLGIKNVGLLFMKSKFIFYSLITVFLAYFFIITFVIYRSFGPLDQLSYLKNDLLNGIKTLNYEKNNKAIFTSPKMALGAIVPIIIDRRVYLGRPMFTPNFDNRTTISDRFYQGLIPDQDAKKLMKENNIGYVILSPIEGYNPKNIENYSFLKQIFENSELKIYQVL